jgi:hypothetical protein
VVSFTNAKAGEIVTRTERLAEPRDFSRPIFWVVILYERARIQEREATTTP